MKKAINKYLEVGTEYYESFEDKLRVRQINLLNILGLGIILPALIALQLYKQDYRELIIIIFTIPVLLTTVYLNRHGQSPLANLITLSCILVVNLIVIYFAKQQMSIPLVCILIAVGSVQLIKNQSMDLLMKAYQSTFLTFENHCAKSP